MMDWFNLISISILLEEDKYLFLADIEAKYETTLIFVTLWINIYNYGKPNYYGKHVQGLSDDKRYEEG